MTHKLNPLQRREAARLLEEIAASGDGGETVLYRLLAQRDNEPHCPSCICGRRAPVQGDKFQGPGTIAWVEYIRAVSVYAVKYGSGQTAERIAERGGFSFGELVVFLGREPTTWRPQR